MRCQWGHGVHRLAAERRLANCTNLAVITVFPPQMIFD